jgi:hypothetical protein
MKPIEPLNDISILLNLELHGNYDDQWETLVEKINHLLVNDFERLVGILYRMDVNEEKLRDLLKRRTDENAGKLIAKLMIERQVEKNETRKRFGRNENSEW